MAQRKSGSSVQGKPAKRSVKRIQDMEIDFSDIPELSEKKLKAMKRVGRPPLGENPKVMIAIRLEPALLESIRRLAEKSGVGYQTLIHQILEKYALKKVA